MSLATNKMYSFDISRMNILSISEVNVLNTGKVNALLLLWVYTRKPHLCA